MQPIPLPCFCSSFSSVLFWLLRFLESYSTRASGLSPMVAGAGRTGEVAVRIRGGDDMSFFEGEREEEADRRRDSFLSTGRWGTVAVHSSFPNVVHGHDTLKPYSYPT